MKEPNRVSFYTDFSLHLTEIRFVFNVISIKVDRKNGVHFKVTNNLKLIELLNHLSSSPSYTFILCVDYFLTMQYNWLIICWVQTQDWQTVLIITIYLELTPSPQATYRSMKRIHQLQIYTCLLCGSGRIYLILL